MYTFYTSTRFCGITGKVLLLVLVIDLIAARRDVLLHPEDKSLLDWFFLHGGQSQLQIQYVPSIDGSAQRSMHYPNGNANSANDKEGLFFVPTKLTISGKVASASPFVQRASRLVSITLPPMWQVALYIFHEKYISTKSFYKPYLDSLPPSFSDVPFVWLTATEPSMASITREISGQGSNHTYLKHLLQYSPSFLADAEDYRDRLLATLYHLHPVIKDVSATHSLSIDVVTSGLLWSWFAVQTRIFSILNADLQEDAVLIPVADLLNADLCSSPVHPLGKQQTFSTILRGYTTMPVSSSSSSPYENDAGRIPGGAEGPVGTGGGREAFISYGDMSGTSLMVNFGLSPRCLRGLDTLTVHLSGTIAMDLSDDIPCGRREEGDGGRGTCPSVEAGNGGAASRVKLEGTVRQCSAFLFGPKLAKGGVVKSVAWGDMGMLNISIQLSQIDTSTRRVVLPAAMLNTAKLMCVSSQEELDGIHNFCADAVKVPTAATTSTPVDPSAQSLPLLSMRNQRCAWQYLNDTLWAIRKDYEEVEDRLMGLAQAASQLEGGAAPGRVDNQAHPDADTRLVSSYMRSLDDNRVCAEMLTDGRYSSEEGQTQSKTAAAAVYSRHALTDRQLYCKLPINLRNGHIDFVSGEGAIWAMRRSELRMIKAASAVAELMLQLNIGLGKT